MLTFLQTAVQNVTEDCKSAIEAPLRPPLRTIVGRGAQRLNSWLSNRSANECSEIRGRPDIQCVASSPTRTYAAATIVLLVLWTIYLAIKWRQRWTLVESGDPENGFDHILTRERPRSTPESSEDAFVPPLPPMKSLQMQTTFDSAVGREQLVRRRKPNEATLCISHDEGPQIRTVELQAILDIGALYNMISESITRRFDFSPRLVKSTAETLSGISGVVEVLGQVVLSFQIKDRPQPFITSFLIVPHIASDIGHEIILGSNFIARNDLMRPQIQQHELEEL